MHLHVHARIKGKHLLSKNHISIEILILLICKFSYDSLPVAHRLLMRINPNCHRPQKILPYMKKY